VLRSKPAVIALVLITAAIGLAVSTWASIWQPCFSLYSHDAGSSGCGGNPWYFDPWWEFWTSVVGSAVAVIACVVSRYRWPRAAIVVAAAGAFVSLSPLLIVVLFDPVGVPILKG
jgi:hypothetical protein